MCIYLQVGAGDQLDESSWNMDMHICSQPKKGAGVLYLLL